MKKVILLNGLPRSGKDTFADYLVENKDYIKLSFADVLKDIICSTFNISRTKLDMLKNNKSKLILQETNGYEEELISFRQLIQNFGTEGIKPVFGDSIWSELVYDKILKSNHNKFVISDFRYLVEKLNSNKLNIKTILIKDKRELPLTGHSSDIELYQNNFKFDIIIENIGTLEEYYTKIDNLIDI